MNIQTDKQIKIWARDGQYGKMYSIGISEKQQDGTYRTSYVPVQFRNGIVIENEEKIYIKSAWLKPTKDNGIKIFINDFETAFETAKKELEEFNPNEVVLKDDELPF